MATRTSARTRRRPPRVVRATATLAVVGGAVTALAGTGAVVLNEPTSPPEVSPALVVLARGEVAGTRLQGVGAALVALGLGVHLGQAGRTSAPRRRPRRK